MDKFIKVGIGVMILDDNQVLLGHRSKDKKDTGGIFEIISSASTITIDL
ncbi:MAG: hypothetical protein Q4C11_01125 [Clostridium sp.]|nr:hypothetical protein [Clostridium sp.]